ncbi:MAG: hypothetical protein AAF640_13390 [Pseudomonadota bacterium]
MSARVCMQRRFARHLGVAAALALIMGCAKHAPELSLDELASRPSTYDGHRVSTEGALHYHASPPHYWIESASGVRVEVLGLQDPVLTPGTELRVTGRFLYSRARGRRIEVESQELRY